MQYGWFKDDFIQVVYDGIEIPQRTSDVDLRKTYHLPGNTHIIFAAGRLAYQKGFDLLIEVARMAKDKRYNWVFLVAGSGRLEKELLGLCRQKGVEDTVKFIGFQSNVMPFIKTSDIFLLPSRSEGMPNVLREAMALGKACVATAVDGVPELIENNVSGLLVEKDNTDQMFEGILKLLKNPGLKESLGNNALERIREKFSMDRMVTEIENLFESQLKKKGQKTQ